MRARNIVLIITTVCLAFFLAVALDISPLLRGPSVAEWRWPYQFINTLNKIWVPGIVGAAVLGLFLQVDTKKLNKPKLAAVLTCLVILGSFWQFSVTYFSRAGIGVLYHRITDPGLNGYYTAGLNISNPEYFLAHYPSIVNNLPMHAKGHPPGGAISYYLANQMLRNPFLVAVFSIVKISLLASVSSLLVYLITKSLRAAFFAATVPGLALFLPLLDVVYPLFGLLSLLFLVKNKPLVSGLIFGLGLFFSYSIWPVFLFMIPFFRKNYLKFFVGGALFFAAMYLLTGYNVIATTLVVVSNQAHRSFLPWVIYNPYDFAAFLGFPLAILGVLAIRRKLLIPAFFIFLTIFSRAEVGRIWLPIALMVPVLAAGFLDQKSFSIKQMVLLISLQLVQTLVIQEFWVPLW